MKNGRLYARLLFRHQCSRVGFGDIRRQRHADGAEDGPDLAAYRGTDGNSASVLLDLYRLQVGTLQKDDKAWRIRTEATGVVPDIWKAIGIALPPRVSATSPPLEPVVTLPNRTKRRRRPRGSATRD